MKPSRGVSQAYRGASSSHARPVRRALSLLCLAAAPLIAVPGAAQIERTVGKDGVIELGNRKQAERERALRKERAAAAADSTADGIGAGSPMRPVMPSPSASLDAARYDDFIREAAQLYHIPAPLIRAVIKSESNFDPRAVSPANARGLMQMMPSTAERMLVTDIFDPRQNILGGTRFLRVLANTFNGNLQLTIAAYNAGPGAVARYGGIPPYAETEAYVARVLQYYEEFRE